MKYKFPKLLTLLMLFFFCANDIMAQWNISGVVTSSDEGLPLIGVNVLMKGETRGAVTDHNGYYLINVNSRTDTLVFSYMGYESQELPAGNSSILNITLKPEVRELEEIVVMAYTEKARTEISSSVISLSADKINDVTVSSIEDMLIGKAAGVLIENATGQPGEAAQMRIRGVGSAFSPQTPLIVVDGIIGGNYNPNDIESVTILKDAGATGLYGSKAASGVLIITTKKGKKGKTEFTVRADRGIKYAETGKFETMNGNELWQYHKLVFDPAVFSAVRPSYLKTLNYDWIGNSFTPAGIGDYFISASGGRDKISFYVSADFLDEDGTAIGSDFKRINLNSRFTMELTDRIKLSTKITGSGSRSSSPHWTYTEMPFRMIPWDNPFDSLGNPIRNVSSWYSNTSSNIFHSSQYNSYGGSGAGAGADAQLDIKIFDWLSLSSLNSVGMGYGKYEEVESPLTAEGSSSNGIVRNYLNYSRSFGTINLLKFNKTFGVHAISGLAGVEGGTYFEEFDVGGIGQGIFPNQDILSVAGTGIPSGNKRESRSISYMTQINYNLMSRYFFTASFRRDGSSKFAPENKYGNFYSFAASWLISNEEFLYNAVPQINLLKLRASYGAVGNETFPDNTLYPYFTSYSFIYKYNNQSAAFPANLGNAFLSWETSYPFNIGMDFGMYSRFEINIDLYNTITKDLLFQDPTAYSKGFKFQWKNVGEIQNKGIEFAAAGDIIRSSSLTWNIYFNIGANKNTLLKLSDKQINQIELNANDIYQVLMEDKEAFLWYMPKWLGVDPANGDPLWEHIIYDENTGEETGRVATNKYSEADFQPVGSPFPDFSGGFGTVVSWKGLSLSAAFNYVYGNEIYNATRKEIDNDGANNNIAAMKLQDGWSRWAKPGDIATHPLPVLGGNHNSYEHSSRFLEDGSYLRVRNVKLSYALPGAWVRKILLEGVNINLSADNLYTWTKFSGMDPDVGLYRTSTWNLPGLSYFKYPISRQYVVGIEIKF
jgi:TonB-linked SusC/RagA family outer membrane protein